MVGLACGSQRCNIEGKDNEKKRVSLQRDIQGEETIKGKTQGTTENVEENPVDVDTP